MSAFEIRPATPEDAKTLLRFIRELATYEKEPDAVQATEPGLAAQMRASPPPFECLLAEGVHGGQRQPWGFALYFQTYSTWRGCPGMWLEDLYVTPEARGTGVGKALLKRLAAICVERGYGRMEWTVLNWNTPALDFYRALGSEPMSEWTTQRLADGSLRSLAAAD